MSRPWLLALAVLAPAPGLPSDSLVPLSSLEGWAVECHDGWRGASSAECDGPSRGRLETGEGGLKLTWELGGADWVQALSSRLTPADLSGTEAVSVVLRGDAPLYSQVVFMAADGRNVFFGNPLLEPAHGLDQANRWEIQKTIPRSSFRYMFNMGGQPPSPMDWTSIERFFFSIVRPPNGPGGSGQLWIHSVSTRPLEISRIVAWREDPPGTDLWTLARDPLAQRERVTPWTMEFDPGDTRARLDAHRTAGGVLVPDAEGTVVFDWDTSTSEWVQAARDLPVPLDLSGADRIFVDLRLRGGTGTANVLYVMLADDGGVYAGYEAGLRRLSLDGYDEYRLRLSLARERFWFHFDLRELRREIDWSRINRMFVGVKRAVGNGEGGRGRVMLEDLTFHRAHKSSVAAFPRREQWTFALDHEWNSPRLSPGVKADLAKVAQYLRWQPGRALRISSVADIRESKPEDLARQRAERVVEILSRDHHVDLARLRVDLPPPHRPFAGEHLPRTVLRLIESN